jgi:hypothetical protein
MSRPEFAWSTLTLDLGSYTEFSVELDFFDGIKNIRPPDRKHLVLDYAARIAGKSR